MNKTQNKIGSTAENAEVCETDSNTYIPSPVASEDTDSAMLATRFQGCTLTATGSDSTSWQMTRNGSAVGQLHTDYQNQLDKVVIIGEDAETHRLVKELALSHAVQFVMQRSPMSPELLQLAPELALEEYTCENLMSFEKIPHRILSLSDETLDKYLSRLVTVVEARFTDVAEMIECLFREIHAKEGILLKIKDVHRRSYDESGIIITFEVLSEHTFKAWNNPSESLHFVPGYHPSKHGKKERCMLNGDTDAYIGGSDKGIDRVLSPVESRAEKDGFLSATWSKVNHPFYAEGKTLSVDISSVLIVSKSGYQALYDLLIAALNIGDYYVSVCGGFRPPYDYPSNVVKRKNLRLPSGEVRGSEHKCVWEYEVLKAEGKLNESSAPNWFYREGWIDIYAGEEKSF